MQVVGVNSLDPSGSLPARGRRAAALRRRQRRRVHGVTAGSGFDPRAVMDNRFIDFTKAVEGIDTIPARRSRHARRWLPELSTGGPTSGLTGASARAARNGGRNDYRRPRLMAEFPAPKTGFDVAHFIVVADVELYALLQRSAGRRDGARRRAVLCRAGQQLDHHQRGPVVRPPTSRRSSSRPHRAPIGQARSSTSAWPTCRRCMKSGVAAARSSSHPPIEREDESAATSATPMGI